MRQMCKSASNDKKQMKVIMIECKRFLFDKFHSSEFRR